MDKTKKIIKGLEELLKKQGVKGKIIDLTESEDEKEIPIIRFTVYACEDSNSNSLRVEAGSYIEDEETESLLGLTNEDLRKMFMPAVEAFSYCSNELLKELKSRVKAKENN